MSISQIIENRFQRSFELYRDLLESMDEVMLSSKLDPLPSNTVGSQLWCVVGARESYSSALATERWLGFSCSLQETTNKQHVLEALQSSAERVSDVLKTIDNYSDEQNRLLIDLLEHEAAHQGQLIRYIYGLQLPIPESWKSRYALK